MSATIVPPNVQVTHLKATAYNMELSGHPDSESVVEDGSMLEGSSPRQQPVERKERVKLQQAALHFWDFEVGRMCSNVTG